jgi:MerR family copper efflux transcriptional regulator
VRILSLTIGQVAKSAGVGVETIRFYERRGLIPEPPRRASGYREYSEEAVIRIRFIRRAKELGFSLGETVELLALRSDPQGSSDVLQAATEEKLADVERKIRSLKELAGSLRRLRQARVEGDPAACGLLECLEPESPRRGGC